MRFHFPEINLHAGVVALFAVALQAIAIFAPLGYDDVPKRLLFQVSYVLLLFFVALNWRRIGILIIGLGLLLNAIPIVSNGGLMPVTSESLAKMRQTQVLDGLEEGDAIPRSKNVWKEREDTHFWALSDRIVWDNPVFFRVFSIGDIVIAGGLIVALGEIFLPRVQRRGREAAPAAGPRWPAT